MTGPLNFFVFLVYKLAVSVLINEGKVFALQNSTGGRSGIRPKNCQRSVNHGRIQDKPRYFV